MTSIETAVLTLTEQELREWSERYYARGMNDGLEVAASMIAYSDPKLADNIRALKTANA